MSVTSWIEFWITMGRCVVAEVLWWAQEQLQ